jgi:hypothetical protein
MKSSTSSSAQYVHEELGGRVLTIICLCHNINSIQLLDRVFHMVGSSDVTLVEASQENIARIFTHLYGEVIDLVHFVRAKVVHGHDETITREKYV